MEAEGKGAGERKAVGRQENRELPKMKPIGKIKNHRKVIK